MRTRHVAGLAFVVLLGARGTVYAAPKTPIDASRLKLGQTVELQGGVKIPKEQFLKELNDLQEALESDGMSFHKAHGRSQTGKLYTHPNAAAEHTRDKAAFTQRAVLLQTHEARGFSGLLVKKGTTRPFLRAPAAGVEGNAAPAMSPLVLGARGPAPDDDPLQVTYEESLGAKNRAAIYVGFGLKDTGDPSTIGCDASLDGGVYLFDQKRQLVKVGATGRIANKQASGSVDVYLMGKAVDGFPKKGAAHANLSWPITPPSAGFSYGWGPISIGVSGAISGLLEINVANTQELPQVQSAKMAASGLSTPHAGKCGLNLVPHLNVTGTLTASVNAVAYRAKVKGSLVFVDMSLPTQATVTARPPNLVEDFDARLDASFLSGEVAIQIDTRIPQSITDGFDWDKVYSKTLFDWDGLKANQKLASFHGKTTKL